MKSFGSAGRSKMADYRVAHGPFYSDDFNPL